MVSVRPLASRFRRPYVSAMDHARIIEQALRDAQDILWTNLPPTHPLSDDATVQELREIVCSSAVTSALKCAADTFFSFELRAVHRILANPFTAIGRS